MAKGPGGQGTQNEKMFLASGLTEGEQELVPKSPQPGQGAAALPTPFQGDRNGLLEKSAWGEREGTTREAPNLGPERLRQVQAVPAHPTPTLTSC